MNYWMPLSKELPPEDGMYLTLKQGNLPKVSFYKDSIFRSELKNIEPDFWSYLPIHLNENT